jgi:hypothetical protein
MGLLWGYPNLSNIFRVRMKHPTLTADVVHRIGRLLLKVDIANITVPKIVAPVAIRNVIWLGFTVFLLRNNIYIIHRFN